MYTEWPEVAKMASENTPCLNRFIEKPIICKCQINEYCSTKVSYKKFPAPNTYYQNIYDKHYQKYWYYSICFAR